jgi:hypothetical protein
LLLFVFLSLFSSYCTLFILPILLVFLLFVVSLFFFMVVSTKIFKFPILNNVFLIILQFSYIFSS